MRVIPICVLALGLAASAWANPPQDPTTEDLLFIAGGDAHSSNVQVVNFQVGQDQCEALADIPFPISGAVGTFLAGLILVCPGDCVYYDGWAQSWRSSGFSMLESRTLGVSIMINASAWWVLGGLGEDRSPLGTTEIYSLDQGFQRFADMSQGRNLHNVVKLNETHFLLLGGLKQIQVYFFNVNTRTWSETTPITSPRSHMGVGVATLADGSLEVVATGGYDGANHATSQIFSVSDQTWRAGPELPTIRSGGTAVQYRDTFIFHGGCYGGGDGSDKVCPRTIFKYDPDDQVWLQMPQEMSLGRSRYVSFFVPNDAVTCS